MKFRYEFGNGESREIEVSEDWYDMLLLLDNGEARNDRRETRRHTSMDRLPYEGEWFAAPDADVCDEVLRRIDAEALRQGMVRLTPQQQELVRRVFVLGERISDIAAAEGVSHTAILDRLKRVYRRLEKNI